MSHTINENAHAVLLPAFADAQLSEAVKHFLSNGGCSILLGETREEYVARKMSLKRRKDEKAEDIIAVTKEAKSLAGDLIVAVDQEVAGICRLHDLVPSFPSREEIAQMGTKEFGKICSDIAIAAKDLGVNCFPKSILYEFSFD